ncbi:MAG: glycerophosphodiester phosphodiesterase family protein, partial [bacterium]|nr:glycerophosphodiester phosphodiesterase family protein [bacterium]
MKTLKPIVFAHRGDSAHAPENTLLALDQALHKGAHGVEFDVWACGSGEIVLFHDRNPLRMTGREGLIDQMSFSELRSLSLPRGERIPSLAEALALMGAKAWINVEIKGTAWHPPHLEREVLKLLEERDLLHRSILSSFNPWTLYRLQRMAPNVHKGLIFKEKSWLPLRKAWADYFLNFYSMHPSVK